MHAIGVGIESPRLFSGNGEWCDKHTLSRGNGRATNRLVGSLGEMPIRNCKWLVQPLGQKGEFL